MFVNGADKIIIIIIKDRVMFQINFFLHLADITFSVKRDMIVVIF